jgi:two-component system, response regulator YesN
MYKLVIVDDEPSVLNGLSRFIDWAGFGIELAGTADDGDTGLALMERVKPDVVLTDVKMPAMDGIRMAQEIRERFPDTKIVFISGHDNAEYLRSALQVHAVDYIFKPIVRKELQDVIRNVLTALEDEQRERRMIREMQTKLTQSLPLLREKFLMSLIRDSVKPDSIREKLQFLDVPLSLEGAYRVLLITVDDAAETLVERSEQDKQLLSYAALNIIQELIDGERSGVVFENRQAEYVCILKLGTPEAEDREDGWEGTADSGEAALLALAERIRDNLAQWLKLSVTIGVGGWAGSLLDLPESYRFAKEAADQRWYLGKNRILTMDSLESGETGRYRFEPETGERVLAALKAGDQERLLTELADIYRMLALTRREGLRYGRNVSLQLVLLSERVLLELNVLTEEWEAREAEAWEKALRLETLADLQEHVTSYLRGVCACVEEKRSGKAGGVIQRIRSLIEERYAENLTVVDIAEGVYLSATYVSLLYKQETGETLFEYLTKVRINKAKELLRDPRNKFYEISNAVGYTDPSHFSKLFKKMTGFTPSAYRDQL